MKRHFVSYHYPCPDGIFAALAARQHFAEAGIQRVHYLPNKVFAPISLKDLTLTVSKFFTISCPQVCMLEGNLTLQSVSLEPLKQA